LELDRTACGNTYGSGMLFRFLSASSSTTTSFSISKSTRGNEKVSVCHNEKDSQSDLLALIFRSIE
jgi:hypothetical protein